VEFDDQGDVQIGTVVAPVSPRFFGLFSLNAAILLPQRSDWLEVTKFWATTWGSPTV